MKGTTTGRLGRCLLALLVALSMVGAFAAPAAAAGDVTVTVSDTDANGIENATVTVYNATDDTEVTNGTTGTDGSVTFSSVADGDYYATATKTDYEDAESDNFTVSGSAVDVNLTLYEESVEIDSTTVEIDESSTHVWSEAENVTDRNNEYTSYDVVFVGINESDDSVNETELARITEPASEGVTISEYQLTDADRDNYTDVQVRLEAPEGSAVESFTAGTYQKVAGGGGSSGGFSLSGEIHGVPIVVIIGALGLAGYMWREQ